MEAVLSRWLEGSGASAVQVPVGLLVPRLAAALAIGVLLAVRPWRWLLRRPLPRPEMMQAQILLCAAAAVVTIVIGDSLAKAFGLVGLGSFVRFRSGLKDPRDAAVLFLVIGLGMACGHGTIGMALAAAVFVAALLAVLDAFKVPDRILTEDDVRKAALASALGPQATGANGVLHASPPVNGAPLPGAAAP